MGHASGRAQEPGAHPEPATYAASAVSYKRLSRDDFTDDELAMLGLLDQ